MRVEKTTIDGCVLIHQSVHEDARGRLVNLFQGDAFREHGLSTSWEDHYYSESRSGVLRGMHLQLPPHGHDKLVTCLRGEVLDVVIDLRESSPTFRATWSVRLSGDCPRALYVPKGVAHGFLTASDGSLMLYNTTSRHVPEAEGGVLWSSLPFDWPTVDPVVSDRDRVLPALDDFISPF